VGAQKEETAENIRVYPCKVMVFQAIRFSIFFDIFVDFLIFLIYFGCSLGTFWLFETPDRVSESAWYASLSRIVSRVRLFDRKTDQNLLNKIWE